ncbi:hypothetical protein TDB9533_02042 [Thalassocella blandensis]|nr:hypothetical protein TDB9533_02042 [Thalassocella blandensis]
MDTLIPTVRREQVPKGNATHSGEYFLEIAL